MPVVTTKNPTLEDPNKKINAMAPGAQQQTIQQASQPANIPYEQPNQLTPVIKPPTPKVTNITQGNETVLQTAQQSALDAQNKPNETMGLVQQGVQGLLKNPLGYDKNAYINNQLEQFDRNRSNAMSAFQQSNADTSNTGLNLEKAYNYAMEGAQGRSDFENSQRMEQADKQRESMLSALTAGQNVSQTQSGLDEAAFNRLLNTRQAGEGERSQASSQEFQGTENEKNRVEAARQFDTQQEFNEWATQGGWDQNDINRAWQSVETEKGRAFDWKTMLQTQGFQGTQSQLDRDLQTALQTNNIAATAANLQKQLDFEKWQTQTNNAFAETLETKKQKWQTIEADLDRQLKVALQNGDIAGQMKIEALKGQITAQLQATEQAWQTMERTATQSWKTEERVGTQDAEKQLKYYELSIQQAMQDKDIDTQKYLEANKEKLQLKLQTQDFTQQEKMAYIDNQYATAKANGDVERQKTLIDFQTHQELETMVQQGLIDETKIMMQGKIDSALKDKDYEKATALQQAQFTFDGTEKAKDRVLDQARIDLQGKGANVDALFAAYDAGTISADTVNNMLKEVTKGLGIVITAPDPMATEKEIVKEFNQTKLQFALTHPEYAVTTNGQVSGLDNSEGAQKAFNDFMNQTYYGTSSTDKGTTAENAVNWNGVQVGNKSFAIAPPAEGATFKVPNGGTYTRSAGNVQDYYGLQSFSAVDSKTGEQVQIIAGAGVKYPSAPGLIFDPTIPKSEIDRIISITAGGTKKVRGNELDAYNVAVWHEDNIIRSIKNEFA
jgi:hypothetical protein